MFIILGYVNNLWQKSLSIKILARSCISISRPVTLGSEVSQLEYIGKGRSATLGTEASHLECIAISQSSTLGAEVSQLECISIGQSATLCTEASKPECIAISRSMTLGSEVSQLECIAVSQSATLSSKASQQASLPPDTERVFVSVSRLWLLCIQWVSQGRKTFQVMWMLKHLGKLTCSLLFDWTD